MGRCDLFRRRLTLASRLAFTHRFAFARRFGRRRGVARVGLRHLLQCFGLLADLLASLLLLLGQFGDGIRYVTVARDLLFASGQTGSGTLQTALDLLSGSDRFGRILLCALGALLSGFLGSPQCRCGIGADPGCLIGHFACLFGLLCELFSLLASQLVDGFLQLLFRLGQRFACRFLSCLGRLGITRLDSLLGRLRLFLCLAQTFGCFRRGVAGQLRSLFGFLAYTVLCFGVGLAWRRLCCFFRRLGCSFLCFGQGFLGRLPCGLGAVRIAAECFLGGFRGSFSRFL